MKFLINYLVLFVLLLLTSCAYHKAPMSTANSGRSLTLNASNQEMVDAFNWAKSKALSYAHDGSDPVGHWYEAALPNREAFCMRDVSHQSIGAEILGLGKHNFNMMLKFAQNISPEKDYCSFWEINRYDKPAPVDYENDQDFWYNLPANFDVTYNAYRLYQWTGNDAYLNHPDLKRFYDLSLNEYLHHWDLNHEQIFNRNRRMHLSADAQKSRFGSNRGIPTYNEGGRGETLLGIDMNASIIAAYKAYAAMLKLEGDLNGAKVYIEKANQEKKSLEDFWWDQEKQMYRSVWYTDTTFDHFLVGNNQAFLHYLFYYDVISNDQKKQDLVATYKEKFDQLIVEIKSYLPIIFYENDESIFANDMIINLCSPNNKRRDYPENSFTVIEHITRGWLGVNADAESYSFSTISRMESEAEWAELQNIPLLSNIISVKHIGRSKTIASNVSGKTVHWKAQIPGAHEFLYVNGHKKRSIIDHNNNSVFSYCIVKLVEGREVTVSS